MKISVNFSLDAQAWWNYNFGRVLFLCFVEGMRIPSYESWGENERGNYILVRESRYDNNRTMMVSWYVLIIHGLFSLRFEYKSSPHPLNVHSDYVCAHSRTLAMNLNIILENFNISLFHCAVQRTHVISFIWVSLSLRLSYSRIIIFINI